MDGGTGRNSVTLDECCSGIWAGLKQIPISSLFSMFWFS